MRGWLRGCHRIRGCIDQMDPGGFACRGFFVAHLNQRSLSRDIATQVQKHNPH